jgi:hypothetical protein
MNKLSTEELLILAKDIKNNLVFHSEMVEDPILLRSIFMPLIFIEPKDKESFDDVGLIYEYISEALPRTINSYPMFMSFKTLHKDDLPIFIEITTKLEEAEQKVIDSFT